MSKVEILTYKDAKKAARTLYASFDNDDVAKFVSRHLEHDPVKRREVDLQLYEAYVVSHMMKGIVFGIKGENHEQSETFETVSLWVKPDSGSLDDYLTLIRSGFAKLAWNTGSEGRRRVFCILFGVLHDECHKIMEIDPQGESNMWTLVYLGSAPSARGKGNVRKMFEHIFKHYIDPTDGITYLESSSVANFPIYEKFGFRAVKDIWLGDPNDPVDKARMDVMIRGPHGDEWKYLHQSREKWNYKVHPNSVAK